jgi:hypothetical protein
MEPLVIIMARGMLCNIGMDLHGLIYHAEVQLLLMTLMEQSQMD